MATTKAGQKAVNKYVKNNYDRINFTISKGGKDILKKFADKQGESVNTYIKKAVIKRMNADKEEFDDCSDLQCFIEL